MRDPWLIAALLLAAVLRAYGLSHDLPFVYNPDEANIMARALALARDPNPHYFLYPSFFFYFLFGVMGALYVIGRLAGRYPSLEAFETRFFEDPTDFFITGRLVGWLAALATIVVTYRLVLRHFGRRAARASAWFMALAAFHVRDTHYLKHDVPAGLLVVLVLVAFDRMMETGRWRSYLSAGLAMGVAFATHYYTVVLAPAFLLGHGVAWGFRGLAKLAGAAAIAGVTFFALSPFVVLDLPEALAHMRANREVVVDRSLDSGSWLVPSLPDYVGFLLEQGLGYVMMVLVALGVVLMARRGARTLVLWWAFPALFLVLLSYTFFAGRYLSPVLPSLAASAGLAVAAIGKRFGSKVGISIAALATVQPLYHAVQIDRLFAGDDTRTVAHRWILEQVPTSSAIALQSYSVPLPQSVESYRESLAANDALEELQRRGKFSHLVALAERQAPTYRLYFVGRGDEKNRIYLDYRDVVENSLRPLRERGVEIVMVRHPPGVPPPEVASFIETIERNGQLLARFSPFREGAGATHPYVDNEDWPAHSGLAHKGPLVEVWRLNALMR